RVMAEVAQAGRAIGDVGAAGAAVAVAAAAAARAAATGAAVAAAGLPRAGEGGAVLRHAVAAVVRLPLPGPIEDGHDVRARAVADHRDRSEVLADGAVGRGVVVELGQKEEVDRGLRHDLPEVAVGVGALAGAAQR